MATPTTLDDRLAEADRLADAALARIRANSRTRILSAPQEQEAFIAAQAAQKETMKQAEREKKHPTEPDGGVGVLADAIVGIVMNHQAAAPAARKEQHMSKKKSTTPKTPKAKREPRVSRGDLVVFAFRLPKADRDLIHKAAGPAGASKFVLNAALTAANKAIEKAS